ncbi:MAG TPA: flagellar biosynthesis protein FlhF [Candidatus Treponema faecavium]|nr:flagellar biosynthesis protein FlhF [Candidatus Treponema faecavium]
MSNNYGDSDVNVIVRKSFDQCIEALRNMYGAGGYHVINQRILPGNLFRRDQVEITYIIRQRQPEKTMFSAADFDRERNKILADAAKSVNPQILKMEKTLAEISQKISDISLAEQNVHPVIAEIDEFLDINEFTSAYRKRVEDRITREFSLAELDDKEKVTESVLTWICEDLSFSDTEIEEPRRPKVIILVGPTGVGKTTTIAKLAAKYLMGSRASGEKIPCIRLVTIDRFRVAAKEQIDRYAQAMGIQSSAVDSASDICEIIENNKDRLDVLLVDTIGYSPNDYENIAKMKKILSIKNCVTEIYLAISASAKANDLRTIMKNYEVFNYSSIIITKYDETEHIGNVISILQERNIPVSYITCGQQVPRDIRRADVFSFLEKLTDIGVDKELLKLKFAKEENYTEGIIAYDGRSGS